MVELELLIDYIDEERNDYIYIQLESLQIVSTNLDQSAAKLPSAPAEVGSLVAVLS